MQSNLWGVRYFYAGDDEPIGKPLITITAIAKRSCVALAVTRRSKPWSTWTLTLLMMISFAQLFKIDSTIQDRSSLIKVTVQV